MVAKSYGRQPYVCVASGVDIDIGPLLPICVASSVPRESLLGTRREVLFIGKTERWPTADAQQIHFTHD